MGSLLLALEIGAVVAGLAVGETDLVGVAVGETDPVVGLFVKPEGIAVGLKVLPYLVGVRVTGALLLVGV